MRFVLILSLFAVTGCAEHATLPLDQQTGPDPVLPPPVHSLIPTIRVAKAVGWARGVKPVAASGWTVSAFAAGLDHPRWLYVLPNGDVLVAESNAPERHDEGQGIRGWVAKLVMKKAGAGVASADRITLLRDADGDGVAEKHVLLEHLHSPFGMALVGDDLYVADTDAVVRFPYRAGATRIDAPGTKVVDLLAGPLNHHWTKNLVASRDGRKLYVTVGSNSNVAENGMAAEAGRAAIWEVDLATGAHRELATGLRNPNGLDHEPRTGALWAVVNERDEIGSDLVPDYLTSIKDGAFYGWPYSYYGQHLDDRAKPQRPDLVARAVKPDYALGPHVAALGLVFSKAPEGAFIGEHGSWNRSPPSGYKVVFIPFSDGKPSGKPVDILTGFLSDDGQARGRPVGVAIDKKGALLVADDVGNVVWRAVRAP